MQVNGLIFIVILVSSSALGILDALKANCPYF